MNVNVNVNAVLDWARANILIITFSLLIIGSLTAVPLVAAHLNDAIRDEVEQRARRVNELRQLERTEITVPGRGETVTGLVNERLLEQLRGHQKIASEDAERILAAALEHNRKGRDVLMPELFPTPPRRDRYVLPQRFHERLIEAYDELFGSVNAGSPPPQEHLREELERRELQFRTQSLRKEIDALLTDEEREQLEHVLRDRRLLLYQEAAERISFYASPEVLRLPAWDRARLPSLAEMFEWQWQYWIHEDLLNALRDANAGAPAVLLAPVKRVLFIDVLPHQAGRSGSGSAHDSGGGGGGVGFMGGAAPQGAGAGGGRPGTPPDPTVEVPLDYSVSLTGRTTNPLYDVRYIDVDLVVETERIPEVLQAIAERNLMTVTQLRKVPADPYAAAAEGCMYGPAPVSRLSLQIETIWLRPWTEAFMPD